MRKQLRPPFIVAGILALLTALLMLPVLHPPTGSEFLNGHDLVNQQYPLWSFIFDSVRDGHGLPLWNPYLYAGQSVVANPQASLGYPPIWLMIPLGVPRAAGILAIVHLWFGGFGISIFLRRFGASWTGTLAGGIVYELSGVLLSHLSAGHLNYVMCQAWLPWIAVAYWWAINPISASVVNMEGAFRSGILAGAAAFGACTLTGYPPLLYFAGVWLLLLWIYKITITDGNRWQSAWRTLWPLIGIGLFGAVLGAVALLPTVQLTLSSTRTVGANLAFSNSYALPGSQLLTMLIPNLFGSPKGPEGYWGLPFYEEVTGYVGWLPLLALLIVRRCPVKVFFGTLLIGGLVVSIGIDGGLFPLLFTFLPGYGLFRVPSRALYFCVIGASGLAAWLLTDLENSTVAERRAMLRLTLNRVLPIVGLLALIGGFVLNAYFTIHSSDTSPSWRTLASSSATLITALIGGLTWLTLNSWRLDNPPAEDSSRGNMATGNVRKVFWRAVPIITLAVLVLDLLRIGAPLVTVSAVDVPEQWKLLAQTVPADPSFRVMTVPANVDWQATASYTRHLNADGYDPLVGNTYQGLLAASDHNPTSSIAQLLGVRYALTNKPFEWSQLPGSDQLTELKQAGDWHVYEVKHPLPHAFFVKQTQFATDSQTVEKLRSGGVDPGVTAFVGQPLSCPGDGSGSASISDYQPNSVTVKADSADGGMLILTDSYDQDWSVTTDGLPAPLVRVDTALRGVCLSAGSHSVHFGYQPRIFWIGAAASIVGWLIVVVVTAVGLIRFRRHAA